MLIPAPAAWPCTAATTGSGVPSETRHRDMQCCRHVLEVAWKICALRAEALQIASDAERRSVAAEDDRSDRWILGCICGRLHQRLGELQIDGVRGMRAGQGDPREAVVDLVTQDG